MEPNALSQVLRQLPTQDEPNLLVGFDTSDDAAVYRIDDISALVQTVDIFPPVVDDPFEYGQIAAANAISDVYAMGGTPKLAMNILCMPEDMDKEIILEILEGGYSKCKEAKAVISGGHTIMDEEPKYGLCVSGFINPSKILKNSDAKEGDILILTKAIGTGIMTTAMKTDLPEDASVKAAVASMATLNKRAAEIMADFSVHACTDITGFGLAGHALEMADGSNLTVEIKSKEVPILPQAYEFAEMGFVPGGSYRNRNWASCRTSIDESVELAFSDLLFDPQTSGGLLIAVPENEAEKLLARLKDEIPVASIVGRMKSRQEFSLEVI